MLTHDQAISFIKDNPVLTISELEKEAGLPKSLLSQALAGKRVLNKKHLSALYPVVTKYGFEDTKVSDVKIISVVNHKGGVGKTTTTINLGRALAILKKKVLVIDMDSQGNLSQGLGMDEPDSQVVNALLKNEKLPVFEIAENLYLSPSDLELVEAEPELLQLIGGFNRLKKVLRTVQDEYDFILIDCPPSLNILTSNAMVASHSCLICLQPEIAAIKGLDKILNRVEQVQEDINGMFNVEGIVFTLVDKRLVAHQMNMKTVLEEVPHLKVFESIIRQNVALTESQMAQQDIFDYDKNSNGAEDYMNLAKELLQNQ